jgi:DNA-binding response OmpR family regulator
MKKILIVEDDENIAKALSIRLKNAGYEVSVAPDALAGVENAVKKVPDLVLLDISLPAGNGFTVAERIQSLIPTSTPLIFLTASKKPGLREKAKELGAAAFFQKPYEWDDLLGAIQLALVGTPVIEERRVYTL